MKLRTETTLKSGVEFSGIGVHSGREVKMNVLPAQEKTGVIFERVDVLDKDSFIKLSPYSVIDPVLCTRLANQDGVSVSVVEHLLAAFRIVGITNAIIKIDSEEVPIMDGSAKVFIDEFRKAGLLAQDSLVPAILIKEAVSVSNKNAEISILPSKTQKICVTLSYDRINPVIGDNDSYTFDLKNDLFELGEARTFGWFEDYEKIKSMGLGRGASEENTIVIMPDNSTKNKLRNEKEIVMHKCLDLIGDMFVIGYDILGEIRGLNISHALNNTLMKKLLSELEKHQIINLL